MWRDKLEFLTDRHLILEIIKTTSNFHKAGLLHVPWDCVGLSPQSWDVHFVVTPLRVPWKDSVYTLVDLVVSYIES